ncbi:hypothetical protein JET64_01255 [Pseudomonas putida]|nr:hypothetical protein [Pseudomonas putida]
MQQADWDELKRQMDTPFGYMKLDCDGFVVSLVQATEPGKKSWGTDVYVNGSLKGIWFNCDHETGVTEHEETRRFFRRINGSLYTKRDLEFTRRMYGKRAADKDAARKWITYSCTWKSFNSLKKHLEANNTSIERLH